MGHLVLWVQEIQILHWDHLVLVDQKNQAAQVLQLIQLVLVVQMVLDLQLVQSALEVQGVLPVHDCRLVLEDLVALTDPDFQEVLVILAVR